MRSQFVLNEREGARERLGGGGVDNERAHAMGASRVHAAERAAHGRVNQPDVLLLLRNARRNILTDPDHTDDVARAVAPRVGVEENLDPVPPL